jgi:hypothetical protein
MHSIVGNRDHIEWIVHSLLGHGREGALGLRPRCAEVKADFKGSTVTNHRAFPVPSKLRRRAECDGKETQAPYKDGDNTQHG